MRTLPVMMTSGALIAAALLGAACAGHAPASEIRFHNQEPIRLVNDRRHVPEKPAERRFYRVLNRYDSYFHRRLTRWMEMRSVRRAANVNSIDEVPDSTWFTNRIGARALPVDELRRGPNLTGSPEAHLPWTVKSSKVGGVAVGFIVEDSRGKKFILKFDSPDFPEAETGADVVVQRLLWAAGYHVPEDYVVHLRREDLVLAKDAVVKDPMGNEEPMTEEFLESQLALVHVRKDGVIRGLASLYLDGEPIGGHPRDGVREDDPNDRVPHQLRRELRGAYTFYSWLDQVDMKEDNSLDMYVKDPSNPKIRYVMHYLVDFGKALGVQALVTRNRSLGRSYVFDLRDMSLSLASLGTWKRPWEGREWPRQIRGVGVFEADSYHPGKWKPLSPTYFPFLDVDRFDGFWASKIIMRFTPRHIRAAVEQGRFSDPRAVEYITRVLIRRQRKTAAYWFARVAPLDGFAVESDARTARLCFDDLSLRHRLVRSSPAATRYTATVSDHAGRAARWRTSVHGGRDGRACLTDLPVSADRDGYTIVRIETARPGQDLPAVQVHMARHPGTRALRVIGLHRE